MRDGLQPTIWRLVLAASIVWGLAGCGAPRHASVAMPVLPAAPESSFDPLAAAPPGVDSSFYGREEPGILKEPSRRLPEPSTLAASFARAESRFEAGKRYYRAGQMDAARLEFDRAVEVLLSSRRSDSERPSLERRLMELAEAIHQYDVSGLGGGAPGEEPVYEKSPLEEIPEPTFPIDPKLRNQVAEELKTTVSQLPLEVTDEVLRYINYFSTDRGRRTVINGLRRAGRYRSMIQRIFDEEGIPQELIHLAQAESGFAPRAVSRRKAAGMWQFIQSRGREYGLTQTKVTDDRLDPEKATRAAARHLRDLYNQFGDWYLAMAAYNCGPLNVERAVARTGYADFWELRRRNVLPKETANYVPIILAMVIIGKNPHHYGFSDLESEPPLEYSTITLESNTSLDLIGDIVEKPVAEVRAMNPALLSNVAPAGYSLHLPAGTSAKVQAALNAVPQAQRATWRLHRVTEGDTLTAIAARYRTTVQKIAAANVEIDGEPGPGAVLVIPASLPPPRPQARKAAAARRASTKSRTTSASAKAPATKSAARARTASSAARPPARPKKAASEAASTASKQNPATRPSSATAAR